MYNTVKENCIIYVTRLGGDHLLSFKQFNIEEGIPIYLQIITYVERGIAAGTIVGGDEMPSRRMLSALIGVNPNTIQKAYRLLEEEGIIESRSGAKSCVTADPELAEKIRRQLISRDVKSMVQGMKQMGITREEAILQIEAAWEED